MKIIIFIFCFFILFTKTSGQNKNKNKIINQRNFEFRHIKTDNTSLQKVEIFRDKKKILTHTLYNDDGDCSSIQIELGNYKIIKHQLIFYTYWIAADRQGLLVYPFGFRKQTYSLKNTAKIKLIESEIYIENYVNDTKLKGMLYLNSNPKTKKENNLLNNYIKAIESKYNGKFVLGEEKKKLQKEVKKALKNEISSNTKNWKEIYGQNQKL